MDSRELGLVLAQQLLDIDDLHYGWWEEGEVPSLGSLKSAQKRYSQRVIEAVSTYAGTDARVLDVGCGTGHLMEQLLAEGFRVDGVIPAPWLEKRVRQRLDRLQPQPRPQVFASKFEEMPEEVAAHTYDVILFSESFQYVPLEQALSQCHRLLAPGGTVVVCDFFKTSNHGDGRRGDKSFGGGHKLARFYPALEAYGFQLLRDDDVTRFISPSVALVDELLRDRVGPACDTLDTYVSERVPRLRRLFGWLFRTKLEKLRYKYLSDNRTRAVFERYKSYRLVAFRPGGGHA